MANGFMMRTFERALNLRPGVRVVEWRMGHPHEEDYKGETILEPKEKPIEHGHWRMTENGIVFIPA